MSTDLAQATADGGPTGPARNGDPASGRMKKTVLFLGGILLDIQIAQIERDSKSEVQYAADTLQRALLKGLAQTQDLDVRLVNVPYISPYPTGYRKLWFPGTVDRLFDRVPVSGIGFFNLLIARERSRRNAALKGLAPLAKQASDGVILVYAAHLPFVLAALACRKCNPGMRVCLIVPDLIGNMRETSGLLALINRYRAKAFWRLARDIDFFVVLTRHMVDQVGAGPENHVVIEGVFDPEPQAPIAPWPDEPGPIFIYTGTLARRYGILDLLAAFSRIEAPAARLWICGTGDAQDAVVELASRDPRVTYYGRVPRSEALALQGRAHVMVNPRRPEGEFTRYSFPSKTMEYLASGRPLIMHWLPGIPEEYRPYLITPEIGDAAGLEGAMRRIAALQPDELRRIGEAGRDFVLTYKTPRVQIRKLLEGLFPGRPGAE